MTDEWKDAPLAVRPNPLAKRLIEAQKAIVSVAREGHNAHHNYAYATSEAIIKAAREALNGAGLSVIRESIRVRDMQQPQPIPGATAYDRNARKEVPAWTDAICIIESTFLLSGEEGSLRFMSHHAAVPERGRPWDKAIAAASTTSLAYALRDLLLIPRADDEPEAPDRRDDRGYAPPNERATVSPAPSGDAPAPAGGKRKSGSERAAADPGAPMDAFPDMGMVRIVVDRIVPRSGGKIAVRLTSDIYGRGLAQQSADDAVLETLRASEEHGLTVEAMIGRTASGYLSILNAKIVPSATSGGDEKTKPTEEGIFK